MPRDGLPTVAVYSDCDRDARHVREADQAVHIGPSEAVRRATCASTRSSTPRGGPAPTPFIPATGSSPRTPPSPAPCRDAGLTFIGPSPEAIALMGSKTARARRRDRARACRSCPAPNGPSTPVRPTRRSPRTADARRLSAGRQSGRRRRRQGHARRRTSDDAAAARSRTARSEAGSAFGDTAVYLERRIVQPAAHRDPAARRPARHRHPVRRARVLDPAAPPEGRRGIAVDCGQRRSCAGGWLTPPPRSRARSATRTPARSSSCSTRTARSTSSR